jgi:hypothetical protein
MSMANLRLTHDVVLTVVRDQGLVHHSPPQGLDL